MKTATVLSKSVPVIVLAAVAGLLLSLASARPAVAWYDDSGWGSDSWSDGWYEAERMQENDQSFQEEQAREAGRAIRRDELEKERKEKAIEKEAYYASIMDASKASLAAPRGAYYRKPGWKSTDPPPPGSPVVTAGPVSLVYERGIYWLERPSDYVVVVPPAGVVVDSLPAEVRKLPAKEGTVYYYFGVFYKDKDGKFEVVKPPSGTYVGYLPDGYTQEGDATTFRFGETTYKQVLLAGVIAYQVV